PQALDALSHLRSSSLILTEERGGEVRFRMLETLREFGWKQLAPEERAEVRCRHRDWYAQFANELQSHPHGGDEGARLDRLEGEQSNLWAALEWCEQDPEGLLPGLRLASTLGSFWTTRGYVRQGREYLERMLARPDGLAQTDDPQVLRARGWALAAAGTLACHQAEFAAAQPRFEEVRAMAERLANDAMLSTSLNCLASVAQQLGDYCAARQLFEESLALKRKSGDPFGLAHSLVSIGAIARLQGDYDTSRALAEEGLSVSRSLRDTR